MRPGLVVDHNGQGCGSGMYAACLDAMWLFFISYAQLGHRNQFIVGIRPRSGLSSDRYEPVCRLNYQMEYIEYKAEVNSVCIKWRARRSILKKHSF